MNHISEESLNEYLDGVLSKEARQELEAHLSGCAPCKMQLQELRQLNANLISLADRSPRRDIRSEVLAQIKSHRVPFVLRLVLSILAGVAIGLLTLSSWFSWRLLVANDQFGVPNLFKLKMIDLHIFQNAVHVPASKFVGVPLPGMSLGLLVLVFALLLALGNFSLLKTKDS